MVQPPSWFLHHYVTQDLNQLEQQRTLGHWPNCILAVNCFIVHLMMLLQVILTAYTISLVILISNFAWNLECVYSWLLYFIFSSLLLDGVFFSNLVVLVESPCFIANYSNHAVQRVTCNFLQSRSIEIKFVELWLTF